jgi:hypothetical protein
MCCWRGEGRVRYFYDTEFHEDGRTIDLVSIGIVAEDGREFYGVSADFDQGRLLRHDWLRQNVWPHLPTRHCQPGRRCIRCGGNGGGNGHLDTDHPAVRPRAQLARAVSDFLLASDGGRVELWADYGAYDHVALCQLWGTMMNLPKGLPMFTCDIQQEAARRGLSWQDLPQQVSGEHNALADARHTKRRWEFLTG